MPLPIPNSIALNDLSAPGKTTATPDPLTEKQIAHYGSCMKRELLFQGDRPESRTAMTPCRFPAAIISAHTLLSAKSKSKIKDLSQEPNGNEISNFFYSSVQSNSFCLQARMKLLTHEDYLKYLAYETWFENHIQ